jgi:antitoxin ParD1/3/4
MRTNIVIDDDLMDAAMKAGGFKTKKDAVEEGLRLVARRATYQNIRALRGKLSWGLEGDWSGSAHSVQERRAEWPVKPVAKPALKTAAKTAVKGARK